MLEIKVILLVVLLATCLAKPALEPDTKPALNSKSDTSPEKAENKTNPVTDPVLNHEDATTFVTQLDIKQKDEKKISDDNTEYLKTYAARMLSYMNLTVEPCDDFYEYACGNWNQVMPDKQLQRQRGNFRDIAFTLGDMMEQLLLNSTLAENLGYGNELKIAQKFYNACLKADLYPLPAADPAYLSLIKSIGGFPAVEGDAWVPTNFSWFNMSSHLSNYGAVGLISEEIFPKYPFMPYFKVPKLGFDYTVHSDNIATNDTIIYKLNEKRMREYLNTFGLPDNQVAEVIGGVFAFWREALSVADKFHEDENMCLQMESEKPFQKWNNYYDIAWAGVDFPDAEGYGHKYCEFYYTELDKVCAKHTVAVANYLAMKLLYMMDGKLKSTKAQRDHCIMNIGSSLPYLMGRLYMETYFTDETNSDIHKIIAELRKSLRVLLENANWLDPETRTAALYKESKIESHLGVLKDEKLMEILIRSMNNLTFVPDSWAQNNVNLKKFEQYLKRYNGFHHKVLSNDTKPVELLLSTKVRAVYFVLQNSINVMAGTLHPPIYHPAWPNSLKFGTLGYVVGHELTHAFDTNGGHVDGNNTLRHWWTFKSFKMFRSRAKCFHDHFDNYLIPEINRNINGYETNDENIADSGGLREAMMAYRSYMKQLLRDDEDTHSQVLNDEQMPGIDLSPEQLFFVGFAQIWCSKYQEEDYWEELTNEHPMAKYRVLGVLSNSEEFSQIFKCQQGSRMNPDAKKCRVW